MASQSAEMRAAMASGVVLGNGGTVLDWIDDQTSVGNALFVTSAVVETLEGERATSTASFCRCCQNVE